MSAHTPGPWTVHQEVPGSSIRIYGRTEHGSGCIGSATYLADAHLMAVAPDLLAALREARAGLASVGWCNSGGTNLRDSIDAAIAKAVRG